MNTALTGVLTGRTRQIVYIIIGVIGLGLGATQVGYLAVPGGSQPIWLTVALSVLGFLTTSLGAIAASNVSPDREVVNVEYGTSLAERESLEDGGIISNTPGADWQH